MLTFQWPTTPIGIITDIRNIYIKHSNVAIRIEKKDKGLLGKLLQFSLTLHCADKQIKQLAEAILWFWQLSLV